MRVLLVNRYWKRYGGVEEVVRDTVTLLEERGHEVVPFAMADPHNWPASGAQHFPANVEFHAGAAGRLRGARRAVVGRDARLALRGLLAEQPVDVAHVFSVYHYLGTGVLSELRRQRVPVILSLHDYKVGCPNVVLYSDRTRRPCSVCLDHRFGYLWAPPLTRCRGSSVGAGAVLAAEALTAHARGAYRRVPAAVTVLNGLQRRAAERAGLDPGRIHHVPNVLELADHATERRDGTVVYVGRLTLDKGVDVLIDACQRARLPLRVVGDGPARAELQRAAGDGVTFTGPVARAEAMQAMRTAAVVAVPSLWPDTAPLVVGEAWSMGAPVVGSDLGGLAEFLADGRGVRCPPGDAGALGRALRAVVDDPPGGEAMVQRAREYARAELSRERWLERMGAVYAAAGATL